MALATRLSCASSEILADSALSSRRVVKLSPRRWFYYPFLPDVRLVVEVTAEGRQFPRGHRGFLDSRRFGTSLYDWHLEVALDGWGVPIPDIAVVERDEDGSIAKAPYLAWCRRHELELVCGRCDQNSSTHRAPRVRSH